MRRASSVACVMILASCVTPHVETYVTTPDRAMLLAREPDVAFEGSESGPTIEVDDTHSYQEIVGFGAALTDAPGAVATFRWR